VRLELDVSEGIADVSRRPRHFHSHPTTAHKVQLPQVSPALQALVHPPNNKKRAQAPAVGVLCTSPDDIEDPRLFYHVYRNWREQSKWRPTILGRTTLLFRRRLPQGLDPSTPHRPMRASAGRRIPLSAASHRSAVHDISSGGGCQTTIVKSNAIPIIRLGITDFFVFHFVPGDAASSKEDLEQISVWMKL
jgi:hypothetical protein